MEVMLAFTWILLFVLWLYVRRRFQELEARIDAVSAEVPRPVQHWPIRVFPRATEWPRCRPKPRPRPASVEPASEPMPAPAFVQTSAEPEPTNWEAVLGGNWFL